MTPASLGLISKCSNSVFSLVTKNDEGTHRDAVYFISSLIGCFAGDKNWVIVY